MTRLNHTKPAVSALWASAFVLAALVIMQAGRLTGPQAHADMAASSDTLSMVTAYAGTGGKAQANELLFMIDHRAGTFLVYEVEDARQKRVILRDGGSLSALFNTARQ
jgi:hypothetical protein